MDYLAILDDREGDLEDMVCDRLGGALLPQEELDVLEPRQRIAIKELLMAFNLPLEAGKAAHLMLLGAFFSPGATIGSMGSDNRKLCLERARSLIDEMLGEL